MRPQTVAALYQALTVLLEREIIKDRPMEPAGDLIGLTVDFTRADKDGNLHSFTYRADIAEMADGQFITENLEVSGS